MANHDRRPRPEIYCRHDNRLVAACPRGECIDRCPLRQDCTAYQLLRSPAVAPPGVHPRA